MDIVTFALCKKLAQSGGGGGISEEVVQQIDEIKQMIAQLEVGQGEYETKLTAIENKVDAINPDIILTELTEVRDELSKKVSARVATI